MNTTEAVDAFLRYLRMRKNRSLTTIDTYRGILAQFADITGNKPVSELHIDDVDYFADVLSLRNYASKTYRCKLNAVRSFVRYLYIKDLADIKPEKVEVPKEEWNKEANFLEMEEAQKFISVIDDIRDKAMMLFLLTSWVRVTEFINIQYDDVHKRSVLIRKGKGGKPRPVFITEEAQAALDLYIKLRRGNDPGPLFPNPDGNSLSRVIVARKVKFYAEKAGIKKKVTPHTLRHTGATTYLEADGRIEEAQQILGHEKIHTTMIYLHFRNTRVHKSFDDTMNKVSYTTI